MSIRIFYRGHLEMLYGVAVVALLPPFFSKNRVDRAAMLEGVFCRAES